jgi:single-strand binding protein
MKKKINNQKGK